MTAVTDREQIKQHDNNAVPLKSRFRRILAQVLKLVNNKFTKLLRANIQIAENCSLLMESFCSF